MSELEAMEAQLYIIRRLLQCMKSGDFRSSVMYAKYLYCHTYIRAVQQEREREMRLPMVVYPPDSGREFKFLEP